MAVLRAVPVHRGSLFRWCDQSGATDVSMLHYSCGGRIYSQIYDDACDMGFYIESHRTGRWVLFTLAHTQKDREGDVLFWEFKSQSGVTVTVFNT